MTTPRLTVRNVRTTGVLVPMTYVLGTSAAAVRSAPLLLVDVETEEGIIRQHPRSRQCLQMC